MQVCKNINQIQTKKLASIVLASDLQDQLKQARKQISVLREANAKLLRDRENDQYAISLLTEEVAFRKEEQRNMQMILDSFHEGKMGPLRENEEIRNRGELVLSEPVSKLHRRSDSSDSKENHPITPKSRVKFDLEALLQVQPLSKRKVFLC